MLNAILRTLAERGWFDLAAPHEVAVVLTRGTCATLELTRRGALALHVKFGPDVDLAEEADRFAAASAAFPGLAPRFVGYARVDGIDLIASAAIEHARLEPDDLLGRIGKDESTRALLAYFAAMHAARTAPTRSSLDARQLVDALRAHFERDPLAPAALPWLDDEIAARLAAVPSLPQHGDFTLNNFGRRPGGLVVFDWEDYGCVRLAGLDLWALLLSMDHDRAQPVPVLLRTNRRLRALAAACCEAMALALPDFEALIPLYVLTFIHLKRRYGPFIRQRALDQLAALSASKAQP